MCCRSCYGGPFPLRRQSEAKACVQGAALPCAEFPAGRRTFFVRSLSSVNRIKVEAIFFFTSP